MASTRAVLQVFEKYQKDRVAFVQTVAELATRPQNIEPMQSAGVMALLRPLLLDNVPRCVERDGAADGGAGSARIVSAARRDRSNETSQASRADSGGSRPAKRQQPSTKPKYLSKNLRHFFVE